MEIEYLCPLLQVFDMKASLAFYVDLLGFHIHESAGEPGDIGWVWLKGNNLDLMLNTQNELPDRSSHPEPDRVRWHHDTILYLGCPDVDGAYRELKDKGWICDPPKVAPYGMKQLYLHDPDGYGICFQWNTSKKIT